MKAERLFIDREATYLHMERYVNDGSPSGFTDIHTTSDRTNPFRGLDRFHLLEFSDDDVPLMALGQERNIFSRRVNYAHPDSVDSEVLRRAGRQIRESEFVVSPTSGARTMLIREPRYGGYLKLTYDVSRIGRVDRQLTLKHCQSSTEVSAVMKSCIDEGKLPRFFGLLLEPSARVSMLNVDDMVYEWGTIYREGRPYPYRERPGQLVPAFALFSTDRHSFGDEKLITQLIRLSGRDPTEYVVTLLRDMVDCYWSVVLNCAFHLECHAQNVLFEVNEDYCIDRIVIKDMDSVDKDILLARHLGLRSEWDSYPYLCFDESVYFYNIRPSYMYDFKLGMYLLVPLLNAVAERYTIDIAAIESQIRQHVQNTYTDRLPQDYFPEDGCWYDCDNTERMPGQKRVYSPHKNPKFR